MKHFVLFILLFAATKTWSQSPNAQSSSAKLVASDLQARAEKGIANGYAPLGDGAIVPPANLLPGFSGASDNTIWVKSGAALAPLGGITASSGNITANSVFIGLLASGIPGIKVDSDSYPLFLRGGSGNKVMVDYGQSIGGANSLRSEYLWSISNAGAFVFAGGSFTGDIDFNSSAISEVGTIAGTALSINMATPTITSSSGNITMAVPSLAGVIVPSTASAVNATFALNPTSANALYGRKASTNTWDSVQTFSVAPVVPDSSFTVAKTTSLQTYLDGALKKDGSNAMSANLNMTTSGTKYRVVGMADPSSSADAVTKGYLEAHYVMNPVSQVTATTPVVTSASTGSIVLSMPAATGSVAGYLSAADWTTFNGKQAALTATAPLLISGSVISMPVAGAAQNGYLSAADYNRFVWASPPNSSPWLDNEIMVGDTAEGTAIKKILVAGSNVALANTSPSVTLSVAPKQSLLVSVAPKSSFLLNSIIAQGLETNAQSGAPGSIYSYAIPADTLAVGDTVTVRVTGSFVTTSTGTMTMSATIASTVIPSATVTALAGSAETPYIFELFFTVRSSTSVSCVTRLTSCGTTVVSASVDVTAPTLISSGLDFTGTTTVNIKAYHGASNASNHVYAETGTTRLN
jgi:hypothetical protein